MDPMNEILTVRNQGWKRHETMIDYCYTNWCVSQFDSIIAYHGDKTYEYFMCKEAHYEEFEINNCVLSED